MVKKLDRDAAKSIHVTRYEILEIDILNLEIDILNEDLSEAMVTGVVNYYSTDQVIVKNFPTSITGSMSRN